MPPGDRRRVLWTCVATVVCAFLSFFVLVPVYPAVAGDLGVGPDLLGLLVGGGQLLGAAVQVPAGVAADRLGRRPFLVAALGLIAVCQVLRWAPGGPLLFALAQAGLGLSLPLVVASGSAAVAGAYAGVGRAEALGLLLASANVGQVTGYLLMGSLAATTGWREVSLALALPAALLTAFAVTLPEPPRAAALASRPRAQLAGTVRFLAAAGPASMLAVAALVVGAGNSSAYLLPFVDRAQGLDARTTALLLLPYVVGSVTLAPLTGRLADRVGTRVPLVCWTGAGAAAAAAFALAGPTPAWVLPCYALLGGAVGSGTSLAAARMAELVAARGGTGLGAAFGGLRSAQSLGPALGPPLAGLVYVGAGFRPAYLLLAAGFAGALASVAWLGRPTGPAAERGVNPALQTQDNP